MLKYQLIILLMGGKIRIYQPILLLVDLLKSFSRMEPLSNIPDKGKPVIQSNGYVYILISKKSFEELSAAARGNLFQKLQ